MKPRTSQEVEQKLQSQTHTREILTRIEDTTDSRYGCTPDDRPMSQRIKYGIINVDKPAGPSSHEVVAWIKRMMKLSHAGHGGTLETN